MECWKCSGGKVEQEFGGDIVEKDCPNCSGAGYIETRARLTLDPPFVAGADGDICCKSKRDKYNGMVVARWCFSA